MKTQRIHLFHGTPSATVLLTLALVVGLFTLNGCDKKAEPTEPAVVGPMIEGSLNPNGEPLQIHPDTGSAVFYWAHPEADQGHDITLRLVVVEAPAAGAPGSQLLEVLYVVEDEGQRDGIFTIEPPGPWPVGAYRVDIARGSSIFASVAFDVTTDG